ncbi:hypothetical protein C8Q80DRAFT_900283 [Daedaleopsis nitida]|nr:hypothetical protein C8Q80DRAFT_900283 [Daedaleopsis nitida]
MYGRLHPSPVSATSWNLVIILSLPATISPQLRRRTEERILVHVVGTTVAKTELGIMVGENRVEYCPFGIGEHSGDVELVTLALSLYTQGTACGLDSSNSSDD